MTKLNNQSNRALFYFKSRINLVSFLISSISIIFIFLNLINLDTVLGFSNIFILDLVFKACVIFSTIFAILFLPSYPLYFIVFKEMKYSPLEKLSFTFVTNLSYYILMGYLGFFIGLDLTGAFFLLSTIIFFFLFIGYIIFQERRNGKYLFFRAKYTLKSKKQDIENFSIIKYLKNLIPLNGFLLIIFIFLFCLLNIVRYDYFFGTDPWIHVVIIKMITEINYLPLNEYYGTVGFHIFGSVIQFFSSVDVLLIPRYFVLYSFTVSALVMYILLKRIFKNNNYANFGVFILTFSSLGFSYTMIQFWPTSIATIFGTFIFFFLYVRLQNFIDVDRPSIKKVFSNIIISYILLTMFFISALLTHSLTTVILLVSYLFVWFIYFLKDHIRGFDFILLVFFMSIFYIFYNFTLISGHFWLFSDFSIPWYIFVGVGIVGGILIWRLQNSILYTKGRFSHTIKGGEYKYYKTIEDKIIIPLIFILIFSSMAIYFISILYGFNLNLTTVFVGFEYLIFPAFGVWGLILYQKKTRGKSLFIWGILLALIILALLFFVGSHLYFYFLNRVIYISAPIIVIGFISYIYKLNKLKSFNSFKYCFIVLFIIGFSILAEYNYQYTTLDDYQTEEREVSVVQWYSENANQKNAIISEFGWEFLFMYYEYPYNNKNETLRTNDIMFFLRFMDDMCDPDNHYDDNGENVLQSLKKQYGSELFLLLSDFYFSEIDANVFRRLSEEEVERYYQMDYMNKICSSKSPTGETQPLYWII